MNIYIYIYVYLLFYAYIYITISYYLKLYILGIYIYIYTDMFIIIYIYVIYIFIYLTSGVSWRDEYFPVIVSINDSIKTWNQKKQNRANIIMFFHFLFSETFRFLCVLNSMKWQKTMMVPSETKNTKHWKCNYASPVFCSRNI